MKNVYLGTIHYFKIFDQEKCNEQFYKIDKHINKVNEITLAIAHQRWWVENWIHLYLHERYA